MSTTLVLSIAMYGGAGPILGVADEPGLCRLFDVDEFAAATGQEYEQPPFWDLPESCKYVAASSPEGRHFVALQLSPVLPYDRVRESALDPIDLEIAGHGAFAASELVSVRDELREHVYVDLDGITFVATLIAEEGTIPDQQGHLIRLAETAVPGLDDVGPAASEPPTAADAVALDLPVVDGISWRDETFGSGADLAGRFDPLLEALGADSSALALLAASAEATDDGAGLGGIQFLRVAGADQAALEEALLEWTIAQSSVDVEYETADVGGKVVTRLVAGDQSALLYVSGETAAFLDLEGSAAERVLEALP